MIIKKSNDAWRLATASLLALCLALLAPAQEPLADESADTAEVDTSAEADTTADSDSTAEADTTAETDTSADSDAPSEDGATAEGTTDDQESTDTPAPAATPKNPRRAASFVDALEAAGEDGIAVYCYGPDWSVRSTRMLKSFWNTPELEAATGKAILLAVPFYEDPTDAQQQEHDNAAMGGVSAPPFGVCPTVMLYDKDGVKYATLTGSDDLGQEGDFSIGYQKLREKIAALHKRDELLGKAASLAGVEKAKVLNEIADLPISPPSGLVAMIKEADPADHSGMVRRNTFSALGFLYEQMHTKDGFLSPDFIVDFKAMEAACMKVIKDEALRPEDRQAAYLLLIGQNRRMDNTGPKLKALIAACAKLAPKSRYGILAPGLIDHWVPLKNTKSSEAKHAQKVRDRNKAKEVTAKERDSKRADKNTEIR